MSFVDELKNVQVELSDEDVQKKEREKEESRKKGIIDDILRKCKQQAKAGNHFMNQSIESDKGDYIWISARLQGSEYGFYLVRTREWCDYSDYPGSFYNTEILVLWDRKGIKEYKKRCKDLGVSCHFRLLY